MARTSAPELRGRGHMREAYSSRRFADLEVLHPVPPMTNLESQHPRRAHSSLSESGDDCSSRRGQAVG